MPRFVDVVGEPGRSLNDLNYDEVTGVCISLTPFTQLRLTLSIVYKVIINSFLYAAHLANCLQDDAIRPLFLVIYAGGMP